MSNNKSNGTVLLRQALPKYNYNGKKLPKNEATPALNSSKPVTDNQKITDSTVSLNENLSKSKPIAVVGASWKETPTDNLQIKKTSTEEVDINKVRTIEDYFGTNESQPFLNNLPKSNRNDENQNDDKIESLSMGLVTTDLMQASMTNLSDGVSFVDRVKELEIERESLKSDLKVQLEVNGELKRLLVASVGEDLSYRVEKLIRDRAQLSIDIGGFSKKMSEDYENYDKVSIQADMWRSKYLASRVMIEELGNARAYLSLLCHDTQDAVQQMLNERHELRAQLLEGYKVLQQVKDAFDPLNSHHSSSLVSTSVLDLSRSIHQLVEAVRFRLLPAHVVSLTTEIEDSLWHNSVTKAEQLAHQVLSRPMEPPNSLASRSSHLVPITSPIAHLSRFHPHTRLENLTFNCCPHCKGDIWVV